MPSKRWRRALAVVKDKHSLCRARVAGRNPDLEAAIVKATSHDELGIDYKNVYRVFAWVRTSPTFLRPLLRALAKRMAKTRSWVVALKGLMLAHGVLSMKIPELGAIGRLPFDLSSFRDKFSDPSKACALSSFVRAYFAYLDQRFASFIRASHSPRKAESVETDLLELQRSQALLNLLMQIRPYSDGMRLGLVLEAMDCVVIDIFEVYSGICNVIASVLARISRASNYEAAMVLAVLRKAAAQGDQLSSYFHVCKSMGVVNASDLPPVEQMPEEDIRDLERMLRGSSRCFKPSSNGFDDEREDWRYSDGTVVRENWVAFQDEFQSPGEKARGDGLQYQTSKALRDWNEFVKWHRQQNLSISDYSGSFEENQRNLICNL